MRIPHRKQQYLGCPSVTQVVLNPNCRDRMIPILRALQHLYSRPQLRRRALELIAEDVLGEADPDYGRPGLTLWQILVLASVRLGCDFRWDHLQDLAENHANLRHVMQVMHDWEEEAFDYRRIRDNICRVRPETIEAINHLIVAEGHRLEPAAAETVRGDSFVAETDIHHPTESSLILDGLKKIFALAPELAGLLGVLGWRQHQSLWKKAKKAAREIGRIKKGGNYQVRLERAYGKLLQITDLVCVLRLELNSTWGLPDGKSWDLYRWYPDPVRFKGDGQTFCGKVSIALRPFDVVLLEAVKPIPTKFAEASRSLEIAVQQVQEKPEPEPASLWTPLEPVGFVSAGGATLTKQKDGSVLAGGENPSPDTYTITAITELVGITAIRLEGLPDESLPANGPGRAVNGNFALTEFRVSAAPQGKPTAAVPVALKNPIADFSQQTYGGWPIAAAIDGDPKTGWSVDPQEGMRHVAVFETQTPIEFSAGTSLSFTLEQGERGHNIGRLRFSATTAKPPIPPPKPSGPGQLIVKGEVPASTNGGLIVVSVKMTRGSQAATTRNVWNWIEATRGEVAEKVVPLQAVVGKKTHAVCWQAWRIRVEPSAQRQDFWLSVVSNMTDNIAKEFNGYFIPNVVK